MTESDYSKSYSLKCAQSVLDRAKEIISDRNSEFKTLSIEWCEIVQKCGITTREYVNSLDKISKIYAEKARMIRSVTLNGLNCSFTTLGDSVASYTRPLADYISTTLPIFFEIFPNLIDLLTTLSVALISKFQFYLTKQIDLQAKLMSTYSASYNKSVKKNDDLIKQMEKKSTMSKNDKSMASSIKHNRDAYNNYANFMHVTAIINKMMDYFNDILFDGIIQMSDAGLQTSCDVFFKGLIEVLDLQSSKIPSYSSLLTSIFKVFSMAEDEIYYKELIKGEYSQQPKKRMCKRLIHKPSIISQDDNDYLGKFHGRLTQKKDQMLQCAEVLSKINELDSLKDSIEKIILDGYDAKMSWKTLKPKITQIFTEVEDWLMASIKLREAEISVEFFSGIVIEANSLATVSFINCSGGIKFQEKIMTTGLWVNKFKIFGGKISDHCSESGFEISPVILYCAEKIESLSLKTEGLFRLAGSATEIRKIRALFEAGNLYPNCDIMGYCDILKEYLRELKEPLLPAEPLKQLEKEVAVLKDGACSAKMKNIIMNLPPVNRANLQFLCQFLKKVSNFSTENKMTSANLALLFATNLNNNNIANILDNKFIKVVYTLINRADEAFPNKFNKFNLSLRVTDIDKSENFDMNAKTESQVSDWYEEYQADSDENEQVEEAKFEFICQSNNQSIENDELVIKGRTPEYIFELIWLPADVELKNPGSNAIFKRDCFDGWRISGLYAFSEDNEVKTAGKLDINELNSIKEDLQKYWAFDLVENQNGDLDFETLELAWSKNSNNFENETSYFSKCLQLRACFDVDKIFKEAKMEPSKLKYCEEGTVTELLEKGMEVKPRLIIQDSLLLKIQIFLDDQFSPMDSPYIDQNKPFKYQVYWHEKIN